MVHEKEILLHCIEFFSAVCLHIIVDGLELQELPCLGELDSFRYTSDLQ